MTGKQKVAGGVAAIAAAAGLALGLNSCGGAKHTGDSDKARDCWTLPDKHGHRHCAS